jgi:SpoVK/Ycf46/Vps4 family AAA+-type ATPase
MAIRDLRRLFEAIGRRDWETATGTAKVIAKAEADRGNHGAARTLEDALTTRELSVALPVSMVNLGLMKMAPTVRLCDVTLSPKTRQQLTSLIHEHRHATELLKSGFQVRRNLILSGPPGCGKSLTAKALATELNLPFFVVRIDAIIGSYLGQTATNLRQLFQFAEQTACVLLFDELDALGKSRGSGMDVGELDRIVIALMQELELANPLGLVVATSNLPGAIDRALWRRFDLHIAYPKARKEQLRAFSGQVAGRYGGKPPASLLLATERSDSFAEAEKLIVDYYRSRLLSSMGEKHGS